MEYLGACETGNLVEIADALTDQVFLVFGNFVAHGLQDYAEELFNEVMGSNMSKTDENGKPIINGEVIYDPTRPLGKILKSDRYYPPRIEKILSRER